MEQIVLESLLEEITPTVEWALRMMHKLQVRTSNIIKMENVFIVSHSFNAKYLSLPLRRITQLLVYNVVGTSHDLW